MLRVVKRFSGSFLTLFHPLPNKHSQIYHASNRLSGHFYQLSPKIKDMLKFCAFFKKTKKSLYVLQLHNDKIKSP